MIACRKHTSNSVDNSRRRCGTRPVRTHSLRHRRPQRHTCEPSHRAPIWVCTLGAVQALTTAAAGHENCQESLAGRSAGRAKVLLATAWCSEAHAQPPPLRLPVIVADTGRTTALTDTRAVSASVAMVGMWTDQQGATDMLNSGEWRAIITVVTITKHAKWTRSMRVDVAEAGTYLTPMRMIPPTMSMLTRAVGGSSIAASMRTNSSQRAILSAGIAVKTHGNISQRARGPAHAGTPARRTTTLRDLHHAETRGIRCTSVRGTIAAANSECHCRDGEAWPCRS